MEILNYNVNEIPIVLFFVWVVIIVSMYVKFGTAESLTVAFISGVMMFVPLIILSILVYGFIEKIDEEHPKVKSRGEKE